MYLRRGRRSLDAFIPVGKPHFVIVLGVLSLYDGHLGKGTL